MSNPFDSPQLFRVSCPDAHVAPVDGATPGRHDVAWWQWGDATSPHVIVCVHGLTRNGRDFDVLAQALLARADGRLRVVCPDVAGRGESDWLADPSGYQIPFYVADMLVLLADLQRRAPIERLDWVGTSMGGLIGMIVAGQPDLPLPKPIERLVLNDVGPAIEWAALARIGEYVGVPVRFESVEQAADLMWRASPTFGAHTPQQWLALTAPMLKPAPGGGWQLHYDPGIALPLKNVTAESVAKGEASLWQVYDQITAKTLLTRGAQSDLLTPATAQAMTQRGPKARLVEFEGVGHAPMFVVPDQLEVAASFLLD